MLSSNIEISFCFFSRKTNTNDVWIIYNSASDNNSDILISKDLQTFEKIKIEKFCSPFRILLILFSSISQAEANSKLFLYLVLLFYL